MRLTRVLLVIVAVVCFGVALSYPIRYYLAQKSNDGDMEQLSRMRSLARTETSGPEAAGDGEAEDAPDGGAAEPAEAGGAPGVDAVKTAEAVPDGGGTVARREDGMPVRVTPGTQSLDKASPVGEAVPEPQSEGAANGEGREDGAREAVTPGPTPEPTATPRPTPTPTLDPYYWDLTRYEDFMATATPEPTATPLAPAGPQATADAGPIFDPFARTGPLPYDMKEKVELDESAILPELADIYELNHDLVGWLTIPDTVIDYPVVQVTDKDNDYYLTHDFYGEENINGQIILDAPCDPYTPGYNLVISGHHMKNGSMFGGLPQYATKRYWEQHKFLEFDTLMARKQYVVFAAFYSADYDEHEEGFRYNANIKYKIDATQWLEEVHENQLYDTEIDAEFGDEFITLTTCNRARHRNGRFVVVARRIREGETFE